MEAIHTAQQQRDCDPLLRDDEGYIAPGLQLGEYAKPSFIYMAKLVIHLNVQSFSYNT